MSLYDRSKEFIGLCSARDRINLFDCAVQQIKLSYLTVRYNGSNYLFDCAVQQSERIYLTVRCNRSKELDQMQFGTAALHGVGLQAIVTEFLITHVSDIFVNSPPTLEPSEGANPDPLGGVRLDPKGAGSGGDTSPTVPTSNGGMD